MNILTNRKFNRGISHQVLHEWEDDFIEVLEGNIKYLKSDKKYVLSRILRKYYGGKTIQWDKQGEINISLVMNIQQLQLMSWHSKNLVPIIFDVEIDEINELYSITKKLPLVYVTSYTIYKNMKKNFPELSIKYMPQSVATCQNGLRDKMEKDIDLLQMGRRNPLLHTFALQYCREHPETTYYYRHHNKTQGMVRVKNNIFEEMGVVDQRKDFINLLSRTQISLCSTPMAECTRNFGENIDFLTARWYESVARKCHIIARWTDEVEFEVQYVGLDIIAINIKNYYEFKQHVDTYRNCEPQISEYKKFLVNNETTVRAERLKQDLINLKILKL